MSGPARSRLDALRRQGGAGEPSPGPGVREALELRLRARHARRLSDGELAERLGGALVAPGVVRVDQRVPCGHRHGSARIDGAVAEALPYFEPAARGGAALFLDTETTGLAGGTGTLAFLIGLARLDEAGLHLRQLFLTGFQGEAAALAEARAFAAGTTALVSYNGKSFDYPLLQARFCLAGMADPFRGWAHVDLLHLTRRAYGRVWPDCRLRTAESAALGFEREHDLPSWEVPEVWQRWVTAGAAAELPRVIAHNRWDVISLAALLPALREAFDDPVTARADLAAGARRHADRGDSAAALRHLAAHRRHLDPDGLRELGRLARRQRDWRLATEVWTELAAGGCQRSLERLAIYWEHQAKEPAEALAIALRLAASEPAAERHRRRVVRLRARLARTRSGSAVP